jgi:hypothetical protein
VSSCPYLAAMCNVVSPLTLACCNNGKHISRISSTKLVVDSDHALRVIVDSNLAMGVGDLDPKLRDLM